MTEEATQKNDECDALHCKTDGNRFRGQQALPTCNCLVNESLQASRAGDLGLSIDGADDAAVCHQHLGLTRGQVLVQICPLTQAPLLAPQARLHHQHTRQGIPNCLHTRESYDAGHFPHCLGKSQYWMPV